MSIYKEIEVTRKRLDVCIDFVYGTDILPIEFKVTDYTIPAETIATAYNQGKSAEVHKQLCSIKDNIISFTPEKGFFEEGRNELQLRVVHNNRNLFTFKCRVECQGSFADSDAEEVKRNSSLVEQVLTEQAVLKARFEEVLKLPEDGSDVEKTLNDIKVGADGKVYSSPGEAVRQQIGQVSEQNAELKGDLVELDSQLSESIANISMLDITDLTYGYKILAPNGELLENDQNYCATVDFVPFDFGGRVINITLCRSSENDYTGVSFYNSEKEIIGWERASSEYKLVNQQIFVPSGTKYMRTSLYIGHHGMSVPVTAKDFKCYISIKEETKRINYVTPEMFGANGNGVSDDYTSLSKALGSGYKVIFDKNKKYYCGDNIICKNGIENANIIFALKKGIAFSNVTNVRIDNCNFQMVGEVTDENDRGEYALAFHDCENIVVSNCRFYNFTNNIFCENSTVLKFCNNIFKKSYQNATSGNGYGIVLENCHRIDIADNYFEDVQRHCIYVSTKNSSFEYISSDITITKNKFTDPSDSKGRNLTGFEYKIKVFGGNNVIISDNIFNGVIGAVLFEQVHGVRINNISICNNIIENCSNPKRKAPAIYQPLMLPQDDMWQIFVNNNIFKNNADGDIRFSLLANSEISNNSVYQELIKADTCFLYLIFETYMDIQYPIQNVVINNNTLFSKEFIRVDHHVRMNVIRNIDVCNNVLLNSDTFGIIAENNDDTTFINWSVCNNKFTVDRAMKIVMENVENLIIANNNFKNSQWEGSIELSHKNPIYFYNNIGYVLNTEYGNLIKPN